MSNAYDTRARAWLASAGLFVALSLWAGLLLAQEAAQDWVPQEIRLPDDMEVIVDRAIGSSTRMFSFRTGVDVEELLAEWRSALEEGGYVVEMPDETILERQIEFSGSNIENAKIAVAPSAGANQAVIEFDASLRN